MGKFPHIVKNKIGETSPNIQLWIEGKIPHMENQLAKRIQERLEDLGLTPTSAAKKVGKTRELLRGVLSGKSQSIKADNLPFVLEALETTSDWLLTGKGPKERGAKATEQLSPDTRGFAGPEQTVPIAGVVAAGIWREVDYDQTIELELGPFSFSAHYPRESQFSLLVEGNSLNKIVPSGGMLHCVRLYEGGITEEMLEPGQLVIVRRTRYQGEMYETTAKRLTKNGHWELKPESHDPDFQEPIIIENSQEDSDETISIAAIVIGVHFIP